MDQLTRAQVLNSLWVEKYRPPTIADMALLPEYREKLNGYIAARIIPHLLFEGPPGSGKTTVGRILITAIDAEGLIMNASDERGIDTVRGKIKNFARMVSMKSTKIVLMDEFDAVTIDAQKALRNTMEQYSNSTRFILTCNYVNKIEDAIISRCQVFHFNNFPRPEMERILKNILAAEKIGFEDQDLQRHIDMYFPDLRRAINEMQHNIRMGRFVYVDQADLFKMITEQLLAGKIKDIRELLAGRAVDYVEIYRFVYDNIDQFPGPVRATVLLEAAEYLYRNSTVPDPEINFIAFCIRTAAACNAVKK